MLVGLAPSGGTRVESVPCLCRPLQNARTLAGGSVLHLAVSDSPPATHEDPAITLAPRE